MFILFIRLKKGGWSRRIRTGWLCWAILHFAPFFCTADSLDQWEIRHQIEVIEGPSYRIGFGGIAYGNGKFVVTAPKGKMYVSEDGINWQEIVTEFEDHFGMVAFGNGRFLCKGNRDIFSSLDGTDWTPTETQLPEEIIISKPELLLGFLDGQFFVADPVFYSSDEFPLSDKANSYVTEFYFSGDGTDFVKSFEITDAAVADIMTGNGMTAIVGDDTGSWTSNEPVTEGGWTNPFSILSDLEPPPEQLWRIFFGVSPDRENWERFYPPQDIQVLPPGADYPPPIDPFRIAYGKGRFIVTSQKSMVTFRSGPDWKPIEGTEDYYSRDLIYAAGHFIGVGDQIITSQDGLQWTERMELPEGQEPLTQVVYGNGRLAAISLDSIWTSGPVHFLSLTKGDNAVNLTLSGARDSTYRIDYRETLESDAPWNPLTTITLEGESQTLTDEEIAGKSVRLYRAVLISE